MSNLTKLCGFDASVITHTTMAMPFIVFLVKFPFFHSSIFREDGIIFQN